ncbi:MAG: ribosome-associated translation inhibitor RaiA [Bacteroidales bacterium]|nr:ribosome-associated translation inhibitor RaiA [Bacteroidales bacterium]
MDIRVQSIRFDADQKLLEFIDKKLSKLSKFYEDIINLEVALTLEPDHKKNAKVRVAIPGNDLVIDRTADTFEDAVVDCADALKDMLVKAKEKRYGL